MIFGLYAVLLLGYRCCMKSRKTSFFINAFWIFSAVLFISCGKEAVVTVINKSTGGEALRRVNLEGEGGLLEAGGLRMGRGEKVVFAVEEGEYRVSLTAGRTDDGILYGCLLRLGRGERKKLVYRDGVVHIGGRK